MMSIVKKMDNKTLKEIYLSEMIKTIPHYQYRFHTIEKYKEFKGLACLYMREIGKKTIREYIQENLYQPRIAIIISSLEEYLRESIKLINSLKIYFPIREDIILMDEINDIPIIVGASADPQIARDTTYPIEYYITNYPHEEEILTEELGEYFFNKFMDKKDIFERKYQRITDNELIDMKEKYNEYISYRIGQPIKQIKQEFEKKDINNYILSTIFLSILTNLPTQTKELEEYICRYKKTILSLPNERK
jgi:hypothetical protein